MSTIMHIDTSKATSDPEAVFGHPAELAHHIGLTRGQKIAALERWALALKERLQIPGEAASAVLLSEVEHTIAELRKDGDIPSPVATES